MELPTASTDIPASRLRKNFARALICLLADRSDLPRHHRGDGRSESVRLVSTTPADCVERQHGHSPLPGDRIGQTPAHRALCPTQ